MKKKKKKEKKDINYGTTTTLDDQRKGERKKKEVTVSEIVSIYIHLSINICLFAYTVNFFLTHSPLNIATD